MSDRRANRRRGGEAKQGGRRTRIVPALLFGLGAGAAPAIQACDAMMTPSNPDGSRMPDDLSFRGFPIDVCGNCWRVDFAQPPADLATPDMAMPDLGAPDLPPADDFPRPPDAASTDAVPKG